jgi:hypothetical protein
MLAFFKIKMTSTTSPMISSSQYRYDTVKEFSMKLKTLADEYEIKIKNTTEE